MLSAGNIFGIINWCLTLISIFIFILILFIYIKIRNQERETDVSILLTMNTCLSAFLTSIAVIIMVSSNIFKDFLLYNIKFCYIFGLFYDIFECSIYYSYSLQSFYRLCRIIYYKNKYFSSYKLYKMLILIQWLLTSCLLIPTLIVNWYIRLPSENYCLIPYTNLIASFYLILVLYSIPLLTIITFYILITKYIHSTTILQIKQRERNLRDLTVIKRISICVFILICLRFPTIAFIIFGILNGHLYFLTYAIVGFVTASCLIFIGLITISITNKFKKEILKYFNKTTNQIQPLNRQTFNT